MCIGPNLIILSKFASTLFTNLIIKSKLDNGFIENYLKIYVIEDVIIEMSYEIAFRSHISIVYFQ